MSFGLGNVIEESVQGAETYRASGVARAFTVTCIGSYPTCTFPVV